MLGETGPPFAAHTITTFLGLAHFSPTGTTKFLDSAASQTTYNPYTCTADPKCCLGARYC